MCKVLLAFDEAKIALEMFEKKPTNSDVLKAVEGANTLGADSDFSIISIPQLTSDQRVK